MYLLISVIGKMSDSATSCGNLKVDSHVTVLSFDHKNTLYQYCAPHQNSAHLSVDCSRNIVGGAPVTA